MKRAENGGDGLGNDHGGSNFVTQFSVLMPANENSNYSTLTLDLTQPEITKARNALIKIMTSDDTSQVAELGKIDEGLRGPYICTMR